MNHAKKVLSLLFAFILSATLLLTPALAETIFIDNENWNEVSAQTVTQLYHDDSSFVAYFFRSTCYNSNLRKTMVEKWMTMYDLTVYGIDCDKYGIPSWARPTNPIVLPVICIVENGKADVFSAKDSIRSIQKRLQEFLGIYDETEVTFSKLNTTLYHSYSTHLSTALAQYCTPISDIPAPIKAEADTITRDAVTDREKVKAIYDWVTTNIYYHHGMLDGTVPRKTTALETYMNKASVCAGYANLTAALCNAAGIPCRVITGFATGIDTESTVNTVWSLYEDYLETENLAALRAAVSPYENHAWNEAFVDGKWIFLDTTWGSNNEYLPSPSGGIGAISAPPTDAYFDPDLEFLSESHLFLDSYSSDLTVKEEDNRILVTGTLDEANVAPARQGFIVSFDSHGKMLECAPLSLSGPSISHHLMKSGNAASVKLFLLDAQHTPVSSPYFGALAQR